MSDQVQAHLCILWEHELRLAAGLLKKLHDKQGDAGSQEWGELASAALNACMGALWGAEDEKRPLMISNAAHFLAPRKPRKKSGR